MTGWPRGWRQTIIFCIAIFKPCVCFEILFLTHRSEPPTLLALANLQFYFQKNLGGVSIATTLVVWRVPQRNRKSLV